MRSHGSITGMAGRLATIVGLVAAISGPAFQASATGGRVQLSGTVAAAGRLQGDSPGYPITLSQSGSYVLTEDLDLTSEGDPLNTTAIQVTADWVTIDLNGFAIVGAVGIGTGIGVSAAGREGVTVRNGVISGMGSHGVELGAGAIVQSLRALQNGGDGIAVGEGSQVVDVSVDNAGADGIHCSGVCIVNNARLATLGDDGIEAVSGATGVGLLVDGCTAWVASDAGVIGTGAMLVRNCTAIGNGRGIVADDRGSLVTGSSSRSNGGDGFQFRRGALLYGNSARNNGGAGFAKVSGGFGTLVLENGSQQNTGPSLTFDVLQPYGLNALSSAPVNGAQLEANLCGSGLGGC